MTADEITKSVSNAISGYGVEDISALSVALAIERFKDLRNYPGTWTEEKILDDVGKNIYKIAMAAIEIDAKSGAEGQISHTENGISRSYTQRILAYRDVIGFAIS